MNSPGTLVIVAAHSGIRLGLANLFFHTMAGWDVSTASDAQAGLLLVQQLQPDAVIVDIRTPNEDAEQTIRILAGGGRPHPGPGIVPPRARSATIGTGWRYHYSPQGERDQEPDRPHSEHRAPE